MLIYVSKLIGTQVLSVQAGGPIGEIVEPIIDPNDLKIIAFKVQGPLIGQSGNDILDVTSIREYSNYGVVIDDVDELVAPDDVIKISEVLKLNFKLFDLKVETKKGSKLGKIIDYVVTSEDFMTQQIIVKRPVMKSFVDPELTISRKEIIEVTDYKVVVKDEEKTLKKRAEEEDFVPNFVNPFRNSEQGFSPADSQSLDAQDIE